MDSSQGRETPTQTRDTIHFGEGVEHVGCGRALGGIASEHGCHVDITLKDVETVQHQPDRIHKWTRIAREIVQDYG